MDNYLVDRETLGQFVDALIKMKYENSITPPADVEKIKEDSIRTLDERVTSAIFNDLNDSQLAELSQLLDNELVTESAFQDFFAKSNINLEQKITDVFTNYKTEFLGGENE